MTDNFLKKQQELIAAQMLAFDELDSQLEDLRTESEDAAKVFKNRMLEMTKAREGKVEANRKIIAETEAQIIQAIKNAGQRLKDIKSGKVTQQQQPQRQ